jgi:adenylate kinase
MNGETRKAVTYGAVMLGVALALGAVIGNDKTRNVIVDKSKDLFSNLQKN